MDEIWDILDIAKIDIEDINYACDRAEALSKLNYSRSEDERIESISIVTKYLGLDETNMNEIRNRLKQMLGEKQPTALIGVLIGLWMAESANLKETDADHAIS